MDEKDIEVLPDGRIALILHDGKLERGMSTHEVKKAFLSGLQSISMPGLLSSVTEETKRLELK